MPDLRPSAIYVITGSRHWRGDSSLVRESMVRFARTYDARHCVLYHGDCPNQGEPGTGVSIDQLAAGFAREFGWEIVAFPADWEKHGKAAGPIRNLAMCRTAAVRESDGAIIELHAWPMPDSKGTHDCLRAARECGLHGVEHLRRERGEGGG